jgi:TFIIF-interacting CTD phosphatase-like protein
MPFLVNKKTSFLKNNRIDFLVKSWFFDPTDTCLLSLLPFLDALRFCRDVRSVLGMNLHLHQNLMITNTNSLTTQVIPSSA